MQIFVGNIPKETNSAELSRIFVQDIEKSLWRRIRLAVVNRFQLARDARFEIVQKRHLEQMFRYGLVDIDDAVVARSFIRALHGSILRGQRIAVREYVHRAYVNERRAVSAQSKIYTGRERRSNERRGAKEYFWEVAQARTVPSPGIVSGKAVDRAIGRHLH